MQALISLVIFGIGVVTTLLIQSYFRKLADETALLNDLVGDIGRIEELACTYWLKDVNDTSRQDAEVAATKLRGALHSTTTYHDHLPKLLQKRKEDYLFLDGRLFDLATGGDFERSERDKDCQRVVEIMTVCNELRILLRSARWMKLFAY